MQKITLSLSVSLAAIIFFAMSCSNTGSNNKEGKASQISASTDSAITSNNDNKQAADTTINSGDTSAIEQQYNPADSMLSQMKDMAAMLGKDSNILKNMEGGSNLDSMMKKMQPKMGGNSGNIGDFVSKSLLNFQLGQMSGNNPLKSVTKGMMEAQKNGTASPSKTYTVTYAYEQPANYTVPVSGNGNTIMLHYTGGSISHGKKDGLWKNIYISTNKANKWNVYSEAYVESSALNMKVLATSLASVNENYSINLNDQYKKYAKQPRSVAGKNESDVQVQKIGNEKMFSYNCVHVRVTYTIKGLGQTAHEQDDEWYSDDVPGAEFLLPPIFEDHSPAVVKKIMDSGCSGALVKSVTASNGSSELIQLGSITKKDMSDSTFILPANYQEDKNTALYDIQ